MSSSTCSRVSQLRVHRLVRLEAAVDGDGQVREILLEPCRDLVAQRRDLAVFLRAQALQPGVARMHGEHAAACFGHGAHEVAHEAVVFAPSDADAVLHRHRHIHRVRHGLHAVGHQARLVHQAGAESAALHALARAAAVQIDLVVAPLRTQARGMGQVRRLAAAEL
jgi:hypothetical protein